MGAGAQKDNRREFGGNRGEGGGNAGGGVSFSFGLLYCLFKWAKKKGGMS